MTAVICADCGSYEDADAILAAAAPDLFEALTAARAAIANLPEDTLGHAGVSLGDFLNPELDQQWPVRDELLNNIDAALLKASHGGTKDAG